MNASNTSGMIKALQNLDGTPYNPPEEVSSTFPKRNWTQTVTTPQDVTQRPTFYNSAALSNGPVPPSTPSHQWQQSSSPQRNPLEAKAHELQAAWESDTQKAYRRKSLRFDNSGLTTDPQKEILYDDTYYYTSTALLKKIIKVQLRSYMPSDVLNRLKTAGVLSGSVPKTLTFAPNESKDFRFRTLLRSSLHQPRSRDLVEI